MSEDEGFLFWYQKAQALGVDVDPSAVQGLRSEDYRIRTTTVRALAQIGTQFTDAIAEMLQDEYPQVRVAAIHALERLDPTDGWRQYLKYECYIPAGEFLMGSDDPEYAFSGPLHRVYLDAYYIGKYPVMNAEYKRYKEDRGEPFWGARETHPVVNVNWYDACEYTTWANMRLPTEAEWEKAASWEDREEKGGRKRKYPWGDEFDQSRCNTKESGIGETPVGRYSPAGDSPYGCADMAGNVWEWTSSLAEEYPYSRTDGREEPYIPSLRALRGGSWDYDMRFACCVARSWDMVPARTPHERQPRIGFRVCIASQQD